MKKMVLLFICVVITSCVHFVDTNYQGEDRGYLVLSMLASKMTNYMYFDLYYKNENGDRATIKYRTKVGKYSKPEKDYDTDEFYGVVKINNLIPGQYELFSYSILNAGGVLNWYPKKDFSYKFEIEPNKITYIGQYRLYTDGAHSVHDNEQRDMEVAEAKYHISGAEVLNFVPKVNYLGQ